MLEMLEYIDDILAGVARDIDGVRQLVADGHYTLAQSYLNASVKTASAMAVLIERAVLVRIAQDALDAISTDEPLDTDALASVLTEFVNQNRWDSSDE
jgi:hypothetical protein